VAKSIFFFFDPFTKVNGKLNLLPSDLSDGFKNIEYILALATFVNFKSYLIIKNS
jgi:hypothetical protein